MRSGLRLCVGLAAAAILLPVATWAQTADRVSVDVVNGSEPTLCAEKDNVYLKLHSGDVRRFTVEAVHPAYIGTEPAARARR